MAHDCYLNLKRLLMSCRAVGLRETSMQLGMHAADCDLPTLQLLLACAGDCNLILTADVHVLLSVCMRQAFSCSLRHMLRFIRSTLFWRTDANVHQKHKESNKRKPGVACSWGCMRLTLQRCSPGWLGRMTSRFTSCTCCSCG